MYYNIFDLVLAFAMGMNITVGIFLLTKELSTVNRHKKYYEPDGYNTKFISKPDIRTYGELTMNYEKEDKVVVPSNSNPESISNEDKV